MAKMNIFTGTLLLTTAIFLLHFVELICSEPRTLEDLFPGYNGVMPPLERYEYKHEGHLRKFETFGDKRLISIWRHWLAKRGHIIFGEYYANFICDLYRLFPALPPVFFVFDMNKDQWVNVSRDLSRALGANRYEALVLACDEVAAKHLSTSKNPVYKEAHIRAYRQANEKADIVEKEQASVRFLNQTTVEDIVIKVKEEYSQAYDRAFMHYIYFHGDHSINGHRGKRT